MPLKPIFPEGSLIEEPCPLCGHKPVYIENPEAEAPHKYYCHGCNRGFDELKKTAGIFGPSRPKRDDSVIPKMNPSTVNALRGLAMDDQIDFRDSDGKTWKATRGASNFTFVCPSISIWSSLPIMAIMGGGTPTPRQSVYAKKKFVLVAGWRDEMEREYDQKEKDLPPEPEIRKVPMQEFFEHERRREETGQPSKYRVLHEGRSSMMIPENTTKEEEKQLIEYLRSMNKMRKSSSKKFVLIAGWREDMDREFDRKETEAIGESPKGAVPPEFSEKGKPEIRKVPLQEFFDQERKREEDGLPPTKYRGRRFLFWRKGI